jgi:S1-C subfamily serine protease
MVPTTNILRRTFHIRYGSQIATCFTVDHANRQYLVTARHVIEGFPASGEIFLFRNGGWSPVFCQKVGFARDGIDIAVLAPPAQISPTFPCSPTSAGLAVGQDAFFLGFPYGLRTDAPGLNGDFPLPLVKKVCVSSMVGSADSTQLFLLDGINNVGFSGGPVVFYPLSGIRELRVAAVISAYHQSWTDVHIRDRESGTMQTASTPFAAKENTGIIISYSIVHAMELILPLVHGHVVKRHTVARTLQG